MRLHSFYFTCWKQNRILRADLGKSGSWYSFRSEMQKFPQLCADFQHRGERIFGGTKCAPCLQILPLKDGLCFKGH